MGKAGQCLEVPSSAAVKPPGKPRLGGWHRAESRARVDSVVYLTNPSTDIQFARLDWRSRTKGFSSCPKLLYTAVVHSRRVFSELLVGGNWGPGPWVMRALAESPPARSACEQIPRGRL